MHKGLFAAAVLLLVSACNNANFGAGTPVQPSGVAGQRNFEAGTFDRIELAGPFDVLVSVGGQPSVRAEGDTGLMERIEVRVEGGRLKIGLERGYNWSGDGRVTVHVTAPSLVGADIAGSGDIRVSPVQSQRFAGSIAGSGNLILERLQAESVEFSVAGSGDVEVSGSAREARVDIAGSGNARLGGLQSETAEISIAGSGNAELRATGTAAVSIVGSGDVTVTGGARCEVSKVGSGDVRCG